MTKAKKKIHYKGFNADWKCQNFQYELGKEYQIKADLEICQNGFHSCKNPVDVFNYYSNPNGKYAEVEISGKQITEEDKTVSSKIKILKELTFWDVFNLGFKLVVDLCIKSKKANTSEDRAHANTSGCGAHANTSGWGAHANTSGDRAYANTSGNRAHANTSGWGAHANTSGWGAHANTSGKNAIACALGYKSKAKAKQGWIILVEYDNKHNIKHIKSGKVGEDIKANTWYTLKNNKFVEVSE